MTVMTRYGFEVSTDSPRAATAFEEALVCVFSASDGAQRQMREALEADPSFALPALALGVLTWEQWEHSGARNHVTEWEREHIDLCLQQSLFGAAEWANKAIEHIREHPCDAWMFDKLHLATFFTGRSKTRVAVAVLAGELARAFPFDAYRQVRHGFALAERGEPQRALLVLDQVLERWPGHLAARHSRIHALHGLGRHHEAARLAAQSGADAGKFRDHFAWHEELVALADGELEQSVARIRPQLGSTDHGPLRVALADASGFAWAHAVASGEALSWPEFDELLTKSEGLGGEPFADLHRAAIACLASSKKVQDLPSGPFRDLARLVRYEDWNAAITAINDLGAHAMDEVGGSRLQRAVLPLMLAYCLDKAGRADQVLEQLHTRFPAARAHPVLGPKLASTVGFRRRVTTPIGGESLLRICVIDSDSASRMRMLQSLGSVAANVSAYDGLSDLDAERVGGPGDELLLVNHDNLDGRQRAQLRERLRKSPSSRCVVCAVETGGTDLAELCEVGGVANIVASSPTIDGNELRVTIEKLLNGEVFGIEKYFKPGVAMERSVLHQSEHRSGLLDSIEDFARDCARDRRRANLFTALADELITNAIYNAPVFGTGERRFSHFPRTRPVTLATDEGLEITWLCDGVTLGLSVADPFGSLDLQQIRAYMATYFRTEKRSARQESAGAGLGLYQAFGAVNKFVCNVEPGKRTEMIGLMHIGGTFRDFRSLAKSFHVFVGGDRALDESSVNEPPRPENWLVQGA